MNRIKTEVKEVSVLLRSIPSLTMTLFYCFGHHYESFGKQKY